jgi:RND superfamily putative drug exporter
MQTLASAIVANPDSYNLGEQLNSAFDSLVAPSGEVTLISIGLNDSNDSSLRAIRNIINTDLANNPGNIESALVTGENALNTDFGASATADLDLILPVTIALLLIATGLFFRSIVTPIVTLGSIGVGLGISMIFIVLIGTFVNQVDFMIPTVLLTVLLGVGTDYSIFIIARHREEMMNGLSVKEAIVKSVTWAGESIATSGTTVIISFLGLSATSIILLQTLGLIVGAGVIVVLACSLTLVPALAALLGEKLFWPNCGARFSKYAKNSNAKAQKKGGYFTRSGKFSVKHAKALILVAIVITIPLFYVYASTTPTYDFLGGADKNLESIKASNMLSDSFGGSTMFPTYVVVNFSSPLIENGCFNATEMAALQEMSTYQLNHPDIKQVTGPTMPYGTPINCGNITDTNSSDYTSITQSIGADNKTALLTVEFSIDPYSSQALSDAEEIRTSLHETFDDANGVTAIYVGGTTGGMIDVKNIFDSKFDTILPSKA